MLTGERSAAEEDGFTRLVLYGMGQLVVLSVTWKE